MARGQKEKPKVKAQVCFFSFYIQKIYVFSKLSILFDPQPNQTFERFEPLLRNGSA